MQVYRRLRIEMADTFGKIEELFVLLRDFLIDHALKKWVGATPLMPVVSSQTQIVPRFALLLDDIVFDSWRDLPRDPLQVHQGLFLPLLCFVIFFAFLVVVFGSLEHDLL